jgi:hypothetical protein
MSYSGTHRYGRWEIASRGGKLVMVRYCVCGAYQTKPLRSIA